MTFQNHHYKFQLGVYQGKEVIWIQFYQNSELRIHLQQHVKVFWSNSQKCWYSFDTNPYRKLFGLIQEPVHEIPTFDISETNKQEFSRYYRLLTVKGYSSNTIRTYCAEFSQFLSALKNYPVFKLTPQELRSYFLYALEVLKLSEDQVHSRINSVKFYYDKVLQQGDYIDIPRPKMPKRMPKTLRKKDIEKLYEVTTNFKHLIVLKLCYEVGLKVSEIENLKIRDFDGDNMQVRIEGKGGRSSRIVSLPPNVFEELKNYFEIFMPNGPHLFEGVRGTRYSKRSIQAVFKNAMEKAKIRRQVGVHGVVSSDYASRLREYGTDISDFHRILALAK